MFTQYASSRSRRSQLTRTKRRQFIVEQLEARQLLAADFVVDAPNKDLELQFAAGKIQVIDVADNSIIRQEAATDIDSRLVKITAATLVVDSTVDLDGNSLDVTANRIELAAGTIKTADIDDVGNPTADSGDVSLAAGQIIIGPGSVINTKSGAGSVFADGTLSLIASDSASDAEIFRDILSPVAVTSRSAAITISGATIQGRDIVLKADGIAATRWDDVGALKDNIGSELLGQLQVIPQIGISQISPLSGQAKVQLSTSEINVLNSTIDSSTSVAINATAESDASINAVAINGTRDDGSKILVSVAFSTSHSSAQIGLDGTTQVIAAERVDVKTSATSTAKVESRADANSRASSSSVKGALNLSGAYTRETSTINLAAGASINAGGTVRVDATGKVENDIEATTSVFQDGTAGLAAAVGVDYATITADIHGKITSQATDDEGALSMADADVNAANNRVTFDSIPASNPLVAGERITYQQGTADLGLVDGREYIVYDVTAPVAAAAGKVSQTVRLVAAETIDLDARQVPEDSTHTLRRISTIRFDAADVTSEAGTNDGVIALAGLPAGVSKVVYLGPSLEGNEDAVSIVGLVQNQEYEVVRNGGTIKLRLPGTTALLDFTAPTPATHGFSFVQSTLSFVPNPSGQNSTVDQERNTIQLANGHGLKTGDLVFYGTDPSRTISRSIDDFGLGDVSLGTLGIVALPDAPIDGLRDELGYRVVVDPDDATKIRLTTSIFAATAASIQDLKSDSGTGHRFTRDLGQQGIIVNAKLEAKNSASAGATLSDEEQPWAEVAIGAAGGQPDSIAAGGYGLVNELRSKLKTNTVDGAKQKTGTETENRDSLDLAGSLAVSFFDHDVLATIAPTAVLTSASDVIVDAKIDQEAKIGSESTATRRGVDDQEEGKDPQGEGADTEISAAIAVGIYNNDAQAVIGSGATTNANAQTLVNSEVDYPLLADSLTAGMNPFLALARGGLDGVEGTLDGTLGLTEYFNVHVSTVAGSTGDKLALAGGVGVTSFTNHVSARIEDNALVNQAVDLNMHNPTVTVLANLSGDLIEAGQMASYNLDIKGLVEALQGGDVSDPLGFLKELVNPFGVSGKNAAGGVLLLTLADNQSIAQIGDKAQVTAIGATTVSAKSDLYNLAVVQTGAQSTDFGFSASIAASDITSKTHASISNNAKIVAGSLNVTATDTMNRVAIAGAIVKGKQTGIGTSVGVNIIEQNVAAFIDRSDNSSGAVPVGENVLRIAGAIDVTAGADGNIFALVMAGAIQGLGKNPTTGNEGGATANVNAKKLGPIALTIPVAYNQVTTNVSAYINNLRARSLDANIRADSNTDIHTVVVGASFGVQAGTNGGSGKLNLAGAGAVGINQVVQNVVAFIKDSDVETTGGRGISVLAVDQSSIESDAGGFGIALSATQQNRAAVSFGVSVAINDISGMTEAMIEDSVVTASAGDIVVDAKSNSTAKSLSIAGGLSARAGSQSGGSFGGAGAVAINDIAKMVSAQVRDGSSVTATNGALMVKANDNSQIIADAGGVGISVNVGSGNSIAGAVGIAIALNEIGNNVTASIDQSNVDAADQVLVIATIDSAKIDAFALAAAGGVAGGTGLGATLAGAGSGAHNDIQNSITASIVSSQVDSTTGSVDVMATDSSTIDADAIGAAISVAAGSQTGVSLAVGVSIAKNEIANHTEAFARNSTLDAVGGVNVTANQNSTITTTSIAASVGVGAGGSTGAGISGAGAGAINDISNQTLAYVDGSTVTSSSALSVLATDSSTITAEIVAAAAAAGAGGTGLGAAIGISVAQNRIGDASTFATDPIANRSASSSAVRAYVNQSDIDVDGSVNVESIGSGTINATVDAVSMAAAAGGNGAAAAGAGVSATNVIEREIVAMIQDSVGSGIDGQSGVFVAASDQAGITTTVLAAALAVAVGQFSAAGSVAVSSTTAKINNKIQAGIRRSNVKSAFGTVSAYATENADVNATATAAAASASLGLGISASGGGAIARGEITSITDAHVRDSTVNAAGLDISAYDYSIADVQTEAIAISIGLIGLGVSGSSATSIIAPRVDALLIDTDVNVNSLNLFSTSGPVATADAAGLTVSTGLAVGVSIATVELGGRVGATIDSAEKPINAEFLSISASANQFQPSRAFAQGSAGGLLLGFDATNTSATNNTRVIAEIEDNTVLNIQSGTSISATQNTWQEADSSSFAFGLAAAGITTATAHSDSTTIGKVDDGVQLTTGSLSIDVFASDTNTAHTTSGAAGGISGAVALPSTMTTSTTEARIDDDAKIDVAGFASISAQHVAYPNTSLKAAAGGLLSGGGGEVENIVDSTVTTRIGNRAQFSSDSLSVRAVNEVRKSDLGVAGNVDATAGGIIAGVGVDSDTELTLRTLVEVGDSAQLTVGNSLTDSLTLLAKNIINATDQLTLRSGGVAAGGINNSSIRTLVDEARVLILRDATIDSAGSINASARGEGVISIQANSETYGGATVGAGLSEIRITPRNFVNVGPNVTITALGDIDLSSGTDTQGNEDVYDIESRVDTFAGSAIPIDIMDATADLLQDNRVIIFPGAHVRSAGNIRLHAERFGDSQIKAQVKAVNWTTALTSAIDGLFAEGGTEQFKGTAVTDAVGTVRIDGNVETGIQRNQVLEIDRVTRADVPSSTPDSPELFNIQLSDRSTDGVIFSKTLTPVTSSLDVALAEAYRNLEQYDENPTLQSFYNNEITRINAKLRAQGLLDESVGTAVPVARQTLTLVIDPIVAQAGSIDIVADTFDGDGTANAPGDASVEIINKSFASLDLRGIRIPDQNGGVFFNSNNITESDSDAPTILVDNVADVTSPELTDNGRFDLTWPSITVSDGGVIENLGGDVTLRNFAAGAGNILVNGTVLAGTPRILAGNQGAVAFNAGDNNSAPFDTGGVAYKNWNALTQGGNGVDGKPIGPGSGILPVSQQSLRDYLAQIPVDVNVFGNRVFVSAQYINLNGVLQSGTDDYELIIDTDTDNEIQSLRNSGASGIRSLTSVSNPNFILRYNFDTDRIIVEEIRAGGGLIDLTGSISNTHNGELRVLGGYSRINIDNRTDHDIQLKRLDVSERGDGLVIIKDLNKGTASDPGVSIYRVEGDSVHADTPEGSQTKPSLNNEFQYIPKDGLRYGWSVGQDLMTRTETTYRSSSFLGFDALAADPDNIFKVESFPVAAPRLLESGAYFYTDTNPAIGDYDFSSSFYNYQNKTSDGGSSSGGLSVFGLSLSGYYERTQIHETGDRFIATHSVDADRPVDIKFLGDLEGSISITSNGTVYISNTLSNISGQTTIRSNNGGVEQLRDGLVGGKTIQITADGPIGSSDSPLRTNVSDRLPHDFLSNRGDAGTMTSVAPTQFVFVASNHTAGGTPESVYRYVGDRANIDLRNEDFTDTSRWVIPQFRPSLGLETNSSDITVREIQGDLPVAVVTVSPQLVPATAGDVRLTAHGSIVRSIPPLIAGNSFVVGTSVHLVAENGSIGSIDNPFQVSTDFLNVIKNPENRLNASAAGDITLDLSETTSIDTITAGGDVRIEFSDADLGTLIDGNTFVERDVRAIEEVTQAVWGDLQLTVELGANEKIDERINANIAARNQAYQAYWNFRSQQPDPSVYDSNFRVSLADDERNFYEDELREQGTSQGLEGSDLDAFVAAGITALEDNRTAQYHDLHADWGSSGDVFDPEFSYTPTADEVAAINTSTKIWTVDELLNLQSSAFLNATDTEFVIEQPNIVARNVYLDVPGGIGQYQNGKTVPLKNDDGSDALLTIDERAAVAAAEPGDIIFLTQAPTQVVASIQSNSIVLEGSGPDWFELGFSVGQSIYLESNTKDTTDQGIFYEITFLDATSMQLSTPTPMQRDDLRPILIAPAIVGTASRDSATHLRILRREDIDLRTDGVVTAYSDRHIFLGSTSDLRVNQIYAAGGLNGNLSGLDTAQRVQIKADGAILDASDSDDPNIIGRWIVLESSQRNIGTEETPLQIDTSRAFGHFGSPVQADPVNNGYLIARAQHEVVISELNADETAEEMFVNQVFSKDSFVRLRADGAILDAFDSDETNIRANEIILDAFGTIGEGENSAGRQVNSLDIDLIGDGTVTAFAYGSIALTETNGNMNLRHIHSRLGNVELVADGSILDAVDVAFFFQEFPADTDADPVVAGNPAPDVVALSVSLTAINGSIGVAGNEVDTDTFPSSIGSIYTLTTSSALDTYVIEVPEAGVPSDLYLNTVTVGSGTAFITAPGGSIFSALPDGATNIFADSVDFGAGWKPLKPRLIGGLFTHIISNGNQQLQVANQSPYRNPVNQFDVNSSGDTSALDALVIINRLAQQPLLDLTAPVTAAGLDDFLYLDPNNDKKVSALDALVIINALARQRDSEAERVASQSSIALLPEVSAVHHQTAPTALAAGLTRATVDRTPPNSTVPEASAYGSTVQAPLPTMFDHQHQFASVDRWMSDDEFLDDLLLTNEFLGSLD